MHQRVSRVTTRGPREQVGKWWLWHKGLYKDQHSQTFGVVAYAYMTGLENVALTQNVNAISFTILSMVKNMSAVDQNENNSSRQEREMKCSVKYAFSVGCLRSTLTHHTEISWWHWERVALLCAFPLALTFHLELISPPLPTDWDSWGWLKKRTDSMMAMLHQPDILPHFDFKNIFMALASEAYYKWVTWRLFISVLR